MTNDQPHARRRGVITTALAALARALTSIGSGGATPLGAPDDAARRARLEDYRP